MEIPLIKIQLRKKLTRAEVLENCKNYKEQASKYLEFGGENPAVIKYNSEWNDKLSFGKLIEIASNFTLQQMIDREMFKRELAVVRCRYCGFEWKSPIQFGSMGIFKSSTLIGNTTNCPNCGKITGLDKEDIVTKKIDQIRENPIGFHELLYPLAQAYDSVEMDVDLEIGGNDQTFNMLVGRDLMKAMKGKEKFVLTMKLLEDENGKKMGKTEGNVVNLDETSENMFGHIMAWSDGLINPGFELCTNIPIKEVAEIDPKKNPRDAKMRLAFEITKINHGEKMAQKTKENFINTFQKGEIPKDVEEVEGEGLLTQILLRAKFFDSNSEVRRLFEAGAIMDMTDNKKLSSLEIVIKGHVYKIGKHRFIKIK